jgi:hypothetical protein
LKITEYIKIKGGIMDWLQFLQIVCVPAFVWLVYKFGELRKELSDFKVQVAKEYATQVHINRLELKIDELREMLWSMSNDTTKRNKK